MASLTQSMRFSPILVNGPLTRQRLSIALSWSMMRSDSWDRRPEAGTSMQSGSAPSRRLVVRIEENGVSGIRWTVQVSL